VGVTFPPKFRSGDIIEIQTSDGPWMLKAVALNDQNFLEVRWEWPPVPEAAWWLYDPHTGVTVKEKR
jgi:hypothetical protein